MSSEWTLLVAKFETYMEGDSGLRVSRFIYTGWTIGSIGFFNF